jgi:hypothetical protein
MFSIVMAMMLAPAKEPERAKYDECLVEFHNTSVDSKMSVANFTIKAKEACTAEREAFHAKTVKDELGFNSTAKEADSYADEEVQGMLDYISEAFAANIEAGAKLMKPK